MASIQETKHVAPYLESHGFPGSIYIAPSNQIASPTKSTVMSLGTTQNTSIKREKRRNIKTNNTVNGSPDKKVQGHITERMLAKRLLMRTERREPATRQRTTS